MKRVSRSPSLMKSAPESKYRNSYDLYAEILKSGANSIRVIKDRVHLNNTGLTRHLKEMVSFGLLDLELSGRRKFYIRTEKSKLFLRRYKNMRKLLT